MMEKNALWRAVDRRDESMVEFLIMKNATHGIKDKIYNKAPLPRAVRQN
jgi:hypothetical protein